MYLKSEEALISNKPRTVIGMRLREIRAKILSSGVPLFDWDDLEREIADRRGDRRRKNDEETNLC